MTSATLLNLKSHKRPALIVLALSLPMITSCGKGKNLGEGLSIGVTPTSAYILPNNAASCVDKAAATRDSTIPLAHSVTGPLVMFNSFKLQWRQTSPLAIAFIRVTVSGGPISKVSKTLAPDEVDALLGVVGGNIPAATTIDSNSAAKPAQFPPCNFLIGSLGVPDGSGPFTAQITIEVVGSVLDSSGNSKPVKQTVQAQAQNLF
jgi:hypothetical protein